MTSAWRRDHCNWTPVVVYSYCTATQTQNKTATATRTFYSAELRELTSRWHKCDGAVRNCNVAITAMTCFNQISETSQTFLNRGSSRRPLIAHKISPDCHIDDRSYLQPTGRWIFLSLSAGRRRSRRSVVGSGAVIHIKLDSAAFSIWKYRISHEYCCFNQAVSSTKEIECRRLIAQCMHNVWKHRKGWVDWYVTTQCYSSLSSLC